MLVSAAVPAPANNERVLLQRLLLPPLVPEGGRLLH